MSKEAFIKHLSLDNKCERKPCCWSELWERSLTREESKVIKELPVVTLPVGHKPMIDDLADETPQRFVAVVGENAYYVNTEGYSYVRYGFKLPRANCAYYIKPMNDPKTTYVTRETFNEVYAELQSLKSQPKSLAIVSFEDIRKASNDSMLSDLHQLQSEAADLRNAGENLLAMLDTNTEFAKKATKQYQQVVEQWHKIARN